MTNQEFKTKLKSFYCRLITLLFIAMLIFNLVSHVSVVDEDDMRIITIDLPFYKTQFIQSREKPLL